MDTFLQKVYAAIDDFDMLCCDEVLVALSGGADSVALLFAMKKICGERFKKVRAIHINHQLRGLESDADELFCKNLCEQLEIPFIAQKIDVKKVHENSGKSIEECARIERYLAFQKASHNGKIATAHTLSDSAETVIFNLTRGTGLRGMCGIPPVRENIIRPLIYCTRAEVEGFLAEENQAFVTDLTNLSTDFSRNKIRRLVVPNLVEINENFHETILRETKIFSAENNFLEGLAEKAFADARIDEFSFNSGVLRKLDSVIRRRFLSKIFTELDLPKSYEKITAAENLILNGGKINFSGENFIVADDEIFAIKKIHALEKSVPNFQKLLWGENFFAGKILSAEKIIAENEDFGISVHRKFANYLADYAKIQGDIILRGRNFGDLFDFPRPNTSSSVKKLLNRYVPPQNRADLIYAADEKGLIFIESLGFSKRVLADGNTRNFIKFTVNGSK
ncbi:MAG: tRNA lysidine(34) synthetase TilS [Oscillospiraceae bacterium]